MLYIWMYDRITFTFPISFRYNLLKSKLVNCTYIIVITYMFVYSLLDTRYVVACGSRTLDDDKYDVDDDDNNTHETIATTTSTHAIVSLCLQLSTIRAPTHPPPHIYYNAVYYACVAWYIVMPLCWQFAYAYEAYILTAHNTYYSQTHIYSSIWPVAMWRCSWRCNCPFVYIYFRMTYAHASSQHRVESAIDTVREGLHHSTCCVCSER